MSRRPGCASALNTCAGALKSAVFGFAIKPGSNLANSLNMSSLALFPRPLRVASNKMTPKEGQEPAKKVFVASWEKDTQEESDADATND
jgi:hypothetical protein